MTDFVMLDGSFRNRERLREAWTSVVGQLDQPAYYHYFEWYESYVNTLESQPELMLFVIAYRNAKPVAVFPLRFGRMRLAGVPVRALEIHKAQ